MKRILLLFLLPIFLLLTSAVQSKPAAQKFPYSGTWIGYQGIWRSKLTLSFSKGGICTFRVKVKNTGEKPLKILSCKMVGKSAITEMQVESGAILVSRVTPLSRGNKIRMNLLYVLVKDEKTGKLKKLIQKQNSTILTKAA